MYQAYGVCNLLCEHRLSGLVSKEIKKADIIRRSGNFGQVIEEYENKRYGEEILNQIKDFHIKKAKLEDDGCYTVADAVKN